MSGMVKKVIQRLKKPVEIHGHQDFGLGVANTIAALSGGVGRAYDDHRPRRTRGQCPDGRRRARAALSMRQRPPEYKTEQFVDVSRFVMDLARVTQPPNRPIVGDKLCEVESGIIAGWIRLARKEHPLEYCTVCAGARRSEAGQHRARQEQRSSVDRRVVRKARYHHHRRREDGDPAGCEGKVVREEGPAHDRRIQSGRGERLQKAAVQLVGGW